MRCARSGVVRNGWIGESLDAEMERVWRDTIKVVAEWKAGGGIIAVYHGIIIVK